ncbi:hypothetical protein [Paenibacillus whitsoniae]|uniref:hypothetical protein n=1 Tax=Paenibacillus whitsoniae TaxID=2496558 RepID=UPI0013DFBBEA|nr:hypothetical protein [Paenibacillus whitsoniae]
MAGRNSKPDNDGPSSNPGRLDQYGDKLASSNAEEFEDAAASVCSTSAVVNKGEQES